MDKFTGGLILFSLHLSKGGLLILCNDWFSFLFLSGHRPLKGEAAEAIGTAFAAETNRRDEDAEM